MSVIIRNRTIRPSTRDSNSLYRIKVENAKIDDEIVIFIDHESKDFRSIYTCTGELFQESDSIHFKVEDENGDFFIKWMKEKNLEKIK